MSEQELGALQDPIGEVVREVERFREVLVDALISLDCLIQRSGRRVYPWMEPLPFPEFKDTVNFLGTETFGAKWNGNEQNLKALYRAALGDIVVVRFLMGYIETAVGDKVRSPVGLMLHLLRGERFYRVREAAYGWYQLKRPRQESQHGTAGP